MSETTSARGRVVARLTADMTSIVDQTVDEITSLIPAYRELRGPQLDDVRAIVEWSLHRLMQLWTAGTAYDHADRARFRAIGAARAADGRPLGDILRAYRVAPAVFVRHIIDHHLRDLDPADTAELSLIVLGAVDALSEEIIDAYTASRDRLASDRGQAQASFLDDLIAGRQNSPGAIADRTRELDVTLSTHPQVLVVRRDDPAQPVTDDDLDRIIDAMGLIPHTHQGETEPRTHVCTRRGTQAILLLPATMKRSTVQSACANLDLRGCLLTGRPIAEVSITHRLGCDALDTAPPHAFVDQRLLDEGDCHLLALLTARATADTDAVVRSVLGPLLDANNAHLLDGLRAFISTGTATAAAGTLHVHPQTLRYRLRRADEVTGRDPRHAWHRLALDTAIQLQHLTVPLRSRRR